MKHILKIIFVFLIFALETNFLQTNIKPDSAIHIYIKGIHLHQIILVIMLPIIITEISIIFLHDLFVFFKFEKEDEPRVSFAIGLLILGFSLWCNSAVLFTKEQFDAVVSFFTFPLFGFLWFRTKMILGLRDKNNHNNPDN